MLKYGHLLRRCVLGIRLLRQCVEVDLFLQLLELVLVDVVLVDMLLR